MSRASKGVLRAQHVRCNDVELSCVCEKESQPFLRTQSAVTEIFKCEVCFCVLRCGNAINIAISLESPEIRFISSGAGK